jgi:hypothetical protein
MKFLKYICLICSFLISTNPSLVAQNNAEAGLDNIFRTSDEEGETAVQPNRRKGQRTQALPEGSERVGCVCMTGAVRGTTGIGSCSGQGGVRYWLIENADGDTLQYPTARQALNSETEPSPYLGPNPQSHANAQPTIIFMPAQPNSFVDLPANTPPQYQSRLDSPIVVIQQFAAPYDSIRRNGDATAALGLPMIFNSLIQLSMILVVCGTLVIIIKMFLQQGTPEASNSPRIFKRIRLTLFKVLLKDNRFFK